MPEIALFPVITASLAILILAGIAVARMDQSNTAYHLAMTATLAVLGIALFVVSVMDFSSSALQFREIAGTGLLTWHAGIDHLNILFYLLVTLLSPLVLLYLHHTGESVNAVRVSGVLVYEAILLAAVTTQELFLFWCLLLLELIPLRMLSGNWQEAGSNAGRIITRYWCLMLVLLLAGMLIHSANDGNFTALAFMLMFFGLAVRLPVFPFHGWLPVMVSQGNMLAVFCFIAGIKTGIYGLLRFVLPLAGDMGVWTGYLQLLALISIFYGALLALMQINLTRLLAFAVISQNGMLLIGLFTFNDYGLSGSILLSNAFGLAATGLILSTGFVRNKTGTVSIPRLGNLFESNIFPALLFLLAALSTMAIPGTPGYRAAHLLLEGVIEENGWLTAIAILIGNVLAAAFLLRAFQQIFIADSRRQSFTALKHRARKASGGEILVSCSLCLLLILAGFSPLTELLQAGL